MWSGANKAPPALSVKRSSRQSLASPYSRESSQSNNKTGLTSELKGKAAITSWETDVSTGAGGRERSASVSVKSSSIASEPRRAATVVGLMRHATMKVSDKLNMIGKWTAAREPEIVQCVLERDTRGGFGLGLNDHNRITHTVPGSSAEKAGLQVTADSNFRQEPAHRHWPTASVSPYTSRFPPPTFCLNV